MKRAFTLAEVLITLGLIGIVTILTLPPIINNIQKNILKNQFKVAYSKLQNGIKLTEAKNEAPYECFYWSSGKTCRTICTKKHPVYNSCIAWSCADGSPLPSNVNGLMTECSRFEKDLFNTTLKTIKTCKNKALENGCIIKEYRGVDDVKKDKNPDALENPNVGFTTNNIRNNYTTWILEDGILIIKYGKTGNDNTPIYTIDINGHKKPNKWGYDIFTFQFVGQENEGIKLKPITYAIDEGGLSTQQMIVRMHK